RADAEGGREHVAEGGVGEADDGAAGADVAAQDEPVVDGYEERSGRQDGPVGRDPAGHGVDVDADLELTADVDAAGEGEAGQLRNLAAPAVEGRRGTEEKPGDVGAP